jgi:hypothetical protein
MRGMLLRRAGLPASVFAPWVEALRALGSAAEAPAPPRVQVLDAELEPLLLSKAAQVNCVCGSAAVRYAACVACFRALLVCQLV